MLFLVGASGLRVFVIYYWILPSLVLSHVLWSSMESHGMFFYRILLTHQSRFRPLTGVIHVIQCLMMF